MNNSLLTIILNTAIIVLIVGCTHKSNESNLDSSLQNEKMELVALGAYPNYYYNLANELSNSGRMAQAIEAYQNCIKKSKRQAIIEDAMYNLSLLYFDSKNESMAYDLMDSLIQRKYTWLNWYKNTGDSLLQKSEYKLRLNAIDSINQLKNNPLNCTFHYQDATNFVEAFQKSQKDWKNAPEYFYTDYFSKASRGLFNYYLSKIQSSSYQFAYRIEDKKNYFESILPNLENLKNNEAQIRDYLLKFESLYPAAIFPDIYYAVGCFNAGGTANAYGLLIGTEMHLKTDNSDLTNFNDWERNIVKDATNLPVIIIHELVHVQQKNNFKDLLGNAIFEGAANFISEKVCGTHINKDLHKWADENESKIWEEFKAEMYEKNTAKWIGYTARYKDRPTDLGYYVGYKICESYYNKQKDKGKAIKDILTISDWHDFYLKSGYMQ